MTQPRTQGECGDLERARRRFLSHVRIEGEHWVWTGSIARPKGHHGWFRLGCRTNAVPTHRAAWLLWRGDAPTDGRVVATCPDQFLCVNPAHLRLADPVALRLEALQIGRSMQPAGEACGYAKLTNAQVREIVRLRESGWIHRQLAAKFGVNESNISHILAGRSWSTVTGFRKRARAVAVPSESV